MTDARRTVPSLDALLRSDPGRRAGVTLGRPLVKQELVRVLAEVRKAAVEGIPPPPAEEILARALGRASHIATGLTSVINATGVILHTGLGRAPMPPRAASAVARAAGGYVDLEVDRETGARGTRTGRAEAMITALTGAEAALVVNNCAAALVLALAALAKGRQVVVSRGELIEIGGAFRIPDIMAASGARLVEVGTTNRTRIGDYRGAVTDRTGAILRVHPSNYRIVGFTAAAAGRDLAKLARSSGVPFIYDVGSGLLAHGRGMPPDEPSVADALEEGADLVTFSGDKLLGGPQAGIVCGRGDLVARLRRHPLARAMRVDKLQVAGLEAVLAAHVSGRAESELPVLAMLRESADAVHKRAQRLSETLGGDLEGAHTHRSEAVVGGGSTPGTALPSWCVRMKVPDPPAFAGRLRTGQPAVFCRVEADHVSFDARTFNDDDLPHLARAILYAIEGDDFKED
jgi:L-seryl-tRNA(Ser) seleniumtransferase